MSEQKSTKEIKELVHGLKLVGLAAKKITKDGKIGLDDLVHLVDLVKESDKLVAAVSGVGDLDDEAKNLDQAEIMELIALLYGAAKEIKEA